MTIINSEISPINIEEKIYKLMLWFEKKTRYPSENIKSVLDRYQNDLIFLWNAEDINEVKYFIDYLVERNLISTSGYKTDYKITVDGFKYLESQPKIIKSDVCFCAMSFDDKHTYIYEKVIKTAVIHSGYKIQRVDEDPHNEGIVDKIMALIRKSKFVIADLTGNKKGVYYEAGFAKGLEKPVIFTCEENDFKTIHFDVQHLNFLKWNKSNKEDAIQRIKWRIEGTIGKNEKSI